MSLALVSCAPSGTFDQLVARIDSSDDPAKAGLYAAASRKAASVRDHLRLASRARREASDGLYRDVVERALAEFPNHPSLAYLAAATRVEDGDSPVALELFDWPLQVADAPELYALAWVTAARGALRSGDLPPDPGPGALGLVADALGSPDPLLVAATFALGNADTFLAERYLDGAAALGASAPELAWELGRFDLVLSAPFPDDPEPGTPEASRSARATELARRADAALLSGKVELARRYYLELVAEAPASSWKPWEALALLAEGWRPDPLSRHGERAVSLAAVDAEELAYRDAQLAKGFPDTGEAVLARAARLSRSGRTDEATLLAESLGDRPAAALLSAAARLRGGDPSRAALDALAAVESAPEDPAVLDSAISLLVRAGEPWMAVLAARRSRAANGAGSVGWFANALDATASGRIDEAIELVKSGGAGEGSFASTASLATLLREAGRRREAADFWALAVRESVGVADKARFLVEEARDRIATGDAAGARAVLAAAMELQPASIEAESLMAAALRD